MRLAVELEQEAFVVWRDEQERNLEVLNVLRV